MIDVLIADDQQVVRQGFELFLSGHPEIRVVGHAKTGVEAYEQVRALIGLNRWKQHSRSGGCCGSSIGLGAGG
ncbi:response regulator transcription factor, partial [Rhodococcus erythropolis]